MMYSVEKWGRLLILLLLSTISLLGIVIFLLLSETNFLLLIKSSNAITDTKAQTDSRLICYYTAPDPSTPSKGLRLADVDAYLCTHINVGIASLENSTIVLSEHMKQVLENEVPLLRARNDALKLMLWIGGGDSGSSFSKMIVKHDTRKIFIKSLKEALRLYALDGVDLDWEFPSAYNKERTHFSQLLYEIKQEFKREKRDYLLSIAVAAVEGIATFAYDIREINLYVDHVNLMAYDYHFYSHATPFTGLNAPLYARDVEHSILATLNINYSVNWWLSNGIERKKLVVGLPTYGHSFTLVNPLNNDINAPAQSFGDCGEKGFPTYSDVCWFISHNIGIKKSYDHQAASPYLSFVNEWISYENETSIAAKTNFIRSLDLGGIMAFSLNTDDIHDYCESSQNLQGISDTVTFPLIKTIKKLLFKKL